jgi:AraC-like DNA-binding protein
MRPQHLRRNLPAENPARLHPAAALQHHISEIAFDSGFNSYQRFHSFFRKFMKTTPKQYRQKYRIDPNLT